MFILFHAFCLLVRLAASRTELQPEAWSSFRHCTSSGLCAGSYRVVPVILTHDDAVTLNNLLLQTPQINNQKTIKKSIKKQPPTWSREVTLNQPTMSYVGDLQQVANILLFCLFVGFVNCLCIRFIGWFCSFEVKYFL